MSPSDEREQSFLHVMERDRCRTRSECSAFNNEARGGGPLYTSEHGRAPVDPTVRRLTVLPGQTLPSSPLEERDRLSQLAGLVDDVISACAARWGKTPAIGPRGRHPEEPPLPPRHGVGGPVGPRTSHHRLNHHRRHAIEQERVPHSEQAHRHTGDQRSRGNATPHREHVKADRAPQQFRARGACRSEFAAVLLTVIDAPVRTRSGGIPQS